MRGPGRRPGAAPDGLPGNRVYLGIVRSFGLGELGYPGSRERGCSLRGRRSQQLLIAFRLLLCIVHIAFRVLLREFLLESYFVFFFTSDFSCVCVYIIYTNNIIYIRNRNCLFTAEPAFCWPAIADHCPQFAKVII